MTQRGNTTGETRRAAAGARPEGARFQDASAPRANDPSPYSRANVGYTPKRGGRPQSRRKFVAIGIAIGAVAVLGVSAGVAVSSGLGLVKDAKAQAAQLSATANQLMDALKGASFDRASELCPTLSQQIGTLRTTLDNGLVGAAEGLTPYGSDIRAAHILLGSLQELTDTALTPLMGTLARYSVDTLVSDADGGVQFNLPGIEDITSAFSAAMPSIRACLSSVDEIDQDLHIDQLASVVNTLREAKEGYGYLLDEVEQLLPLVPPLLGSRGPRSYLVVAQANSEVAATGGFPGAMGFATLDGGRFDMGEFGSVWDVLGRQESPLPLSDEELALYGEAIGFAPDAMGHNPDFPRAAELWALSCAQANGFSPAGVVALDPVFLQDMLALVGASVPTSDGTSLDGGNAARELLSDVYWRHLGDYDAQDAFFGEAASGAAEAIMEGLPSADPGALLGALAGAFEDRRLNLWLADPDEQAVLERLDLDNGVAGSPDKPELGVFLSDASWAKLEWYLRASLELGPEGRSGGARSVPAALTLENTITQDEVWAAGGDTYIVGSSELRRQDGDMVLELTLYAPVGGSLQGLSCDGGTVGGEAPEPSWGTHLGRGVAQLLVRLLPGESSTVRFEVALPEGCEAPLEVDMTPLAQGAQVSWL